MLPHVLVLFNEPTLPPTHPLAASEHEVLETAQFVAEALAHTGHRVTPLGLGDDPLALLRALREHRPDVIFNLYEGVAENGQTEAYLAGLLEWLGVPYTGCPFPALVLARDKPRTKLLLQGAGLPTPRFHVADRGPLPDLDLRWPVIAKLATEDASVGLDQGSVTTSFEQLQRRVGWLLDRFHVPVLLEEFIAGRELNVALVEAPDLRVLPISEIVFTPQEGTRWGIVTYDAKWCPDSADDLATTPKCPADLPADLTQHLGELATAAFRLVGCRDYARVDFRLNAAGEPFILEVNPNPDFHPHVGLARSLRTAGVDHAAFTVGLVRRALARAGRAGEEHSAA
jgi:D-alanine-D-alanine ligase